MITQHIETAQEFIERKKVEFQTHGKTYSQAYGDYSASIEALTYMPSQWPTKVFLFERIHRVDNGAYLYRISYYILENGEWKWRRGCPMFDGKEFEMLSALARVEGTLI